MPSFFKRHPKTPTPPSRTQPDTAAGSSSATLESGQSDNPSLPSAVVPPEIVDGEDEDLDRTKRIGEAFRALKSAEPAFQDYEPGSKWRKGLDWIAEQPAAIQEKTDTAENVVELVKPAYESDTMQVVRGVVTKVVDSIPMLLKALDVVAQLYPFISIAVAAFRIVVELHLKRRDNDKKVGVLFDEMRDMMGALLQLSGIKDKKIVGPDGQLQTIKDRMQTRVNRTADDIRECANVCDAYLKKNSIVKVIQSPMWDDKLQDFIRRFTEHRKKFVWALAIHVGVGVDEANKKLEEMDAKIIIVLDLLSKALSPEQQELFALVQRKGGPTVVMADNNALIQLIEFRPATATLDRGAKTSSGREGAEHNSHQDGDELMAVKLELFDTPEISIQKNWAVFERKLKMQQKELTQQMQQTVHYEINRAIKAVTDGPHNRILDPDIREIWKEMRWSGHVKARHFVLALRDYYRQQLERKPRPEDTNGDSVVGRPGVAAEDEWALEWININRLQAIAEAFDDDASGFITIAEVNYFSTSRPEVWSLPHWLAYWAIGWQVTMTKYRDMIVNICAKMFAIRPHIHPANRNTVDTYLQNVWQKIATLTLSFVDANQPDSLQERFKSYVEAEEERLREGLETFRYDVDAMDTLLLITGPGRIEKYLFPLLWLLLKRDFEIFRLCRHTIIHKDELWDSADTILWVLDAVTERHNDLEALFKQQKLDPGSQFKTFASELYDYWHDFNKVWRLDTMQMISFAEIKYDDSKDDQHVNVSNLLNYPSTADDLYPLRVEDPITETDATSEEAVRLILGRWNGVQILENEVMLSMPITFYFHASVNQSQDFRTYEANSVGVNGTSYNILGGYMINADGTVEYSFTQTYIARIPKTYWTATLEDDGKTLSGKWGYKKEDQPHTFVYKRTPLEVLVDRPLPEEFTENRVKALWKYALTAVGNHVRRQLCEFSWSDLKARREVRKEYLELLMKEAHGRLTKQDTERSSVLARLSTPDDVRSFYIIHEYRQRLVRPHFGIDCDHCREPIHDTRVVCMECGERSTLDFCDKPACVSSTVTVTKRNDLPSPHLPTHDFVKIRAPIVHYREIVKVLRNATAALGRATKLLEEMEYQKRLMFVERMSSNLVEVHTEAAIGENGKEDEDVADHQDTADDADEQDGEGPVSLSEALAKQKAVASSGSKSGLEIGTLTCLKCEAAISRPCLYCIDCPEERRPFICWECDEQAAGFSHGDYHVAEHSLVRCMPTEDSLLWAPATDADNTDKRLGALEHKLEGLTGQMEGLTGQMEGLTNQMEKIETLLHDLARMRRE